MKKILLFLSFMVFIGSNAQIFDALKDVAKKKVTEKATEKALDFLKKKLK